MKSLTKSFFLMLMMSSSALADTMYPVITYTCDSKADVIKIKNEVKWNEEGQAVEYKDGDDLAVYNPWNWVSIENKPPRKLIRQSQIIEKSCQLSSGIYKVLIQPHIFNVNALAKCGDQISAKVTVLRGGTILQDKLAMQEFCHGNAPIIRGIKIFGDTGKIKIYSVPRHKFY
ncbi:MAG: hypothetical protein OQK76_05680 [Gammaproteobacteria bacterium]|nr:hypothetical protein [Gammaproteobacteria bacterium]MCW8910095.1 hypothetical protein [Gammaproteobacteria bacterium]MCW9057053.1 hypothetical protein [Gammaproteobacteria bacterium]